jgi:nucleoside-diphosphate-sugar epimerase
VLTSSGEGPPLILVTGAGGFVGPAVCAVLKAQGYRVRGTVREEATENSVAVGDIGPDTDWRHALDDVQAVVHLAARVHVMRDRAEDPLTRYREVNTAGTLRLAEAAVASGAGRFVYVSSIKVNGECTSRAAFSETDGPAPADPYAVSKWEAEQGLRRIADETGLEVVVVRPPLVYGPGVKGNFLALMRLIKRGLPLPVGACDNRRSLVGLSNLVDLLVRCVSEPRAAGETFLAGDGEDLSTPELVRRLARALGRPARLVPSPPRWFWIAARLFGNPGLYDRFCGSLQVDISKARRVLDWTPPVTIDEEFARTVSWFIQKERRT